MNIETFKSLNLHFEELLFHCNDRMSDHVATAIVCNRRQMHGWKENYGNFVSTSDGKQKRRCAEIKAEKILTDNFGERAVNLLRFWNDCKCSKFGWCDDYSGVNHEAFMTLAFSKRREIAEIKATEYVLDQLPVSPTLCFDSSSSPSSLWLSSSSSSSQSSG